MSVNGQARSRAFHSTARPLSSVDHHFPRSHLALEFPHLLLDRVALIRMKAPTLGPLVAGARKPPICMQIKARRNLIWGRRLRVRVSRLPACLLACSLARGQQSSPKGRDPRHPIWLREGRADEDDRSASKPSQPASSSPERNLRGPDRRAPIVCSAIWTCEGNLLRPWIELAHLSSTWPAKWMAWPKRAPGGRNARSSK